MHSTILVLALLAPSLTFAQPCFSPACGPVELSGPSELCLPDGCNPVQYTLRNGFALAESKLPNNYPVLGWSGPCLSGDCPDLLNQAFADLSLNALKANRAQRHD